MRKPGLTLLVTLALAATALLAMAEPLGDPVRWTPDGLFYQARSLELQGVDRDVALERVFQGEAGAELSRVDPERSGEPAWVAYNAQFYERRVTVPLAAAALDGLTGDRSILYISVAGYVAAILCIFGLLLLRFRLPVAAAVALVTLFLPALTHHAGLPLTDSWGLALETAAFAAAALVLQRGPRWLIAWAAAIVVLSFTRDSMWVPVLAAAGLTLVKRSRVSWQLLGTGVAAALPVLLLFSVPMRELLAAMLNDFQPAPGASWGFVAERYPGALVELARADGGFVRGGEWYSALFLAGGLGLLLLLGRGRRSSDFTIMLKAGAVAAVGYVLVVPIFSAFRLELVCVPMAAYGLALGVEWLAERAPSPSLARLFGALPRRERAGTN